MQESLDALRQIPHVVSVEVLDEDDINSDLSYASVQQVLNKKKKLSLIGKDGCAVFFSLKSSIILIKSEPNVNLGAIDLLLDSIE